MTRNEKITAILDAHGVENRTSAGRVWAVESWAKDGKYHEDLVDVTDWTKNELLAWLGY